MLLIDIQIQNLRGSLQAAREALNDTPLSTPARIIFWAEVIRELKDKIAALEAEKEAQL